MIAQCRIRIRSGDPHSVVFCLFLNTQVSDLTSQMQGQQTLLAEQKQQIEEMRRQIERNMSQNRLAKLRADTARYRRPQL